MELLANEPATVLVDEVRLIQVIMNLIDNALTYTNAGGKVKLEVRAQNNSAILTVRDTGIGIAPEHLEHIFERFYRVDPARSRAAAGAELSLSIVTSIVIPHARTITVSI